MEENLKYRRHDIEGGYIYNKADIDYYRTKQRVDVSCNGLLGDFNMVGSYVVNKALVEELIKMYKVYTDTFHKTIFCESLKTFDDKKIKFSLNIIPDSPLKGKVTASLVLLEEVEKVNGYYTDTNSVVIDSRVFNDRNGVEQEIFEKYNIHKQDETGAKVENDYEFPAILRRLNYLKDVKKECDELCVDIEKELYEKRMEAVLKSKVAPKFIEEFNRQVFHAKEPFLNKKDKLFYRYINQIFDNVVESISLELEDLVLINALRKIQAKYAEAQYNIETMVTMKLQSQLDASQKKEYEQYQKITKVNIVDTEKQEKPEKQQPKDKIPDKKTEPKVEKANSSVVKEKNKQSKKQPKINVETEGMEEMM